MADQTPPPAADARFLAVLREIADRTVDQTGTSLNGEVWVGAYKPLPAGAPWDAVPEPMSEAEWLDDILGMFLRDPGEHLAPMLAARKRLGENLRLIEDIDVGRLRGVRHKVIEGDQIDALLDFVDEIRKIAKEI